MALSPHGCITTASSVSLHHCITTGAGSSLLHCFTKASSSWLLLRSTTASSTCLHHCITTALSSSCFHCFITNSLHHHGLVLMATSLHHRGLILTTASVLHQGLVLINAALHLLGLVLITVSLHLHGLVLCAASRNDFIAAPPWPRPHVSFASGRHFPLNAPVLGVGLLLLHPSRTILPGAAALFPCLIHSWGLWPLLLVLPRTIQSRASGRLLFLNDPVRGAAAPAAYCASDDRVRGIWSHFTGRG